MPAIPPSPAEAPELWDTLSLGSYLFPRRYPGFGRVKVTCDGGADVDRPKANGKDGAEAKFKGRKVCDFAFEVQYTRLVWNEALAFYLAIDPQGAGYGLIWETTHPACAMRGANKVLVETLSGIVTTGDVHTFSGKGSGWNSLIPKGKTTTPTKAEPFKPGTGPAAVAIYQLADALDFSRPKESGFNGPNGPKAGP